MSFHSYMETFAEAWVAANTQTAVNLQMAPRQPETRPLRPSEVEHHELPTMLSKDQLGTEPVPLALIRSPNNSVSPPTNAVSPQRPVFMGRHLSPSGSASVASTSPMTVYSDVDDTTVPIHCIMEPAAASSSEVLSLGRKDTYIVLPGFTPFKEVIHAVLLKAGYSHSDVMGAKGCIQIKQWQPLSMNTICKDPDATVHQVLGDLTNVATLRIKMYGYDPDHDDVNWNDQTVRCAVNDLLKEMNQTTLAKLSPLSQSTISNIVNSKYLAKIGPEKCQNFGIWYRMFRQNQVSDQETEETTPTKDTRLTFHPTYELPKMRDWYRACKTPSDQVLRRFLDEINEGHVRQQRPKVTLSKLKNWWKNEKQRERKIQHKKDLSHGDQSQEGGVHGDLSCLALSYHDDAQDAHHPQNPNMNHMRDPMLSNS